jgi:hypothetical protein
MASESAKAVAREVSEAIRKGQPVILGKIIRKKGYSKSTSESPQRITETKSYKKIMKPLIDQLDEERQAVIKDMVGKRKKAKYRDLTDALDKITKNIQLLGGKPTGNNKLEISWK